MIQYIYNRSSIIQHTDISNGLLYDTLFIDFHRKQSRDPSIDRSMNRKFDRRNYFLYMDGYINLYGLVHGWLTLLNIT
jgi:hypothetical protein